MKLLLPLLALLQSIKVAAEFAAINIDGGSYDDIKSVVITPSCSANGGANNKVPVTMFTILPSNSGVEVSSDPPDLVSVSSDGGTLSINSWNIVDSTSGGVKISLPPSQLTSVSAGADTDVQILDGFTALENIDISGDSEITATVSSAATPISISVEGDSTLTLSTGANVEGMVEGDSSLYLEAPTFNNFKIMGDSTVEVKGNVGSGNVMGDSEVTVTGEVTASVSIMGDSEFNAPSCDNIVATGDSTCSTGSQDVEVDTSEQPMTKSVGSFSCGGTSITISSDNGETVICTGDGCNGSNIHTLRSMIGGIIAAAAIALL